MAISDFLNGAKFRARAEELERDNQRLTDRVEALSKDVERLNATVREVGALDAVQVRALIARERALLEQARANAEVKVREVGGLKQQIDELQKQVLVLEESVLLESFALYLPKFAFANSAQYKSRLDEVRERQKKMIKEGTAAIGNMNWTVNNNAAEGRRLVNDMIKLVIRSFNNEVDYCVDNVKFNNIAASEKRIDHAFETLNKLGRVMSVRISDEYRRLKLDELHLAHEFQVKKQQEKEEQKRAREELREQQKLEQEIRAARERIAKERRHFQGALKDIEARLQRAKDEQEKIELEQKAEEIRKGFDALQGEEQLIDYREKNAKAGYVYVISNVGSFGDGVFKIGMTRRLEPLERVDELGDASVPFDFDVHALVFSENAPNLEAKLHEHFAHTRINKINGRKEFFRARIEEIELVIRENYDKVVEVVREPAAEEYREGLRTDATRRC